jgi:hypothetical protein
LKFIVNIEYRYMLYRDIICSIMNTAMNPITMTFVANQVAHSALEC